MKNVIALAAALAISGFALANEPAAPAAAEKAAPTAMEKTAKAPKAKKGAKKDAHDHDAKPAAGEPAHGM